MMEANTTPEWINTQAYRKIKDKCSESIFKLSIKDAFTWKKMNLTYPKKSIKSKEDELDAGVSGEGSRPPSTSLSQSHDLSSAD